MTHTGLDIYSVINAQLYGIRSVSAHTAQVPSASNPESDQTEAVEVSYLPSFTASQFSELLDALRVPYLNQVAPAVNRKPSVIG